MKKAQVSANAYSDDCSSIWDSGGFFKGEHDVQGEWHDLYHDGNKIGEISTEWKNGGWEFYISANDGHVFSLKP